ncbi:autorepressor SdpR family transcription factor [Culicoidibacter larvae]|uniref:Winged helix-turn-helix transcriptional regulator n=1 Tax=Culicoidibacter larvae TaxID=2579976 RepID=A0A5R8QGL6_9FIRM|nr:autorepressor SdpR family transcription factor [Culicoidibacter larvae]TLG77155.1 winged helix-turn-helix transcriptional regulator [Culicoidibacter larvae]
MQSVFKALSDPTRREILQLLKKNDMTAGEIASFFNMSKPSISHHLTILKQADLIIDNKKGQHIWYSINLSVFSEVIAWFMSLNESEEKDNEKE